MKRAMAIALCAILLATIGCSDSDENAPGSGADKGANAPDEIAVKMYGEAAPPAGSDHDMILTFTPPDDWMVTRNPSEYVLLVAHSSPQPDVAYPANLTLIQGSILLVKDKTLDGFAAATMENMARFNEGVKEVSSNTVTLGENMKAKEVLFTCTKYGGLEQSFKGKKWMAVGYRSTFDLTAICLEANWEKNEPLFDAAAKSLRWVPAPEQPDATE